ncbi:autophagy-related protein 13 homolog [Pollicipes pollicipes]|uniref:autophagy-related protein 13 homolog n=1 Tax=Pollicipes pollicipes TaxID=41117 RepID=UPI00188537D6|nr:autophagy-related protein 13 homolog [Pollicipes pollicipes]
MDSEKKEFEKMVNMICRKMAHIIVESRLGKKIHTPCKVHADGPDWFNLSTDDMPDVVKEVKRLLASSGGLSDPASPLSSFCVEISLKTADGVPLVLEQWSLTLDRSAGTGARPSTNVINQLGILLKSLVVTTRLTTAYKLSRQQSQESHIIFYKIYIGEPDIQSLGEASEQLAIGEVCTPNCSFSLALHHRTRLALSTHSDPIVMKSDHFKPELSPRVRRVTAFVERRHSDSVEMIGVSSSSSSNMDTKTTGGSSTDSDQRRRVAAFADDPGERPPAAAETPSAAPDDFVMVELRTPFSESDSDSELGAFFRQWQAAPTLPTVAERRRSLGSAAPAVDPQLVSLTHQLQTFQLKSREYDEMIAQLSQTELDGK